MDRKIIIVFMIALLGVFIHFHSHIPFFAEAQTPCASKTQGDANCDTNIDDNDYILWRCEFLGNSNCSGDFSELNSDFNHDSQIDLLDFEIWRAHRYVGPTVTQSVPTDSPTPTTPQSKPDLIIGNMSNFCITYEDGSDTLTVNYDFTVKNSGEANSPANVSEITFANPNLGINPDINTVNLPEIAPNATTRVNGQKNINCPLCAALVDPSVGLDPSLGMIIALDRNETIDEENELNNAPNYVSDLCAQIPENNPTQ